MNKQVSVIIVVACLASACISNRNSDRVVFQASSAEFAAAAEEYRDIWQEDGERIIESIERATGLRVEPNPIDVIVYEGVSRSGYRDVPMYMRASYPTNTKKATFVHELSHRLISDIVPRNFEDHPIIFLFLYDVWVELWGESFADAQVVVESRRRGIYDYNAAWRATLEIDSDQRAMRWNIFLKERARQQ